MSIRTKRFAALLLAMALALCPLFEGGMNAYAQSGSVSVSGRLMYANAFKVLELVNAEREKEGLTALKMDKALLSAAMQRSGELAVYFNHTRPNGEDCLSVSSAAKAENIAAGQYTAQSVMTSWINSSGHKANILGSYTKIGIGCFAQDGCYHWVQLFGTGSANAASQSADADATIEVELSSDAWPASFTVGLEETQLYVDSATQGVVTLRSGYFSINADPGSVSWSSSDESVARVSKSGRVTAVRSGVVRITAGICGVEKSVELSVAELRNYVRLGGEDRIATAILISESGWSSASNVVLANGYGFADALAGVPLAHALGAPILLTSGDRIENEVAAQLKVLGTKTVYILGGANAISAAAEASLRLAGYRVARIWGEDRYETAVAIAKKLASISGASDTVFFTCSDNYPDALAISAVAALTQSPILYVASEGAINPATAQFISGEGAYSAVLVGGTNAISESVRGQIKKLGFSVTRVSGANRYATAAAVCESYDGLFGVDAVAFATGTNFPDALAGAALAAKLGVPVLLTDNRSAKAGARNYLLAKEIRTVYIFGGEQVVSGSVVDGHF